MLTSTTPVYLTVKQLCEKHPAFTEGGIRHLIFHAGTNGFAEAFHRVGRKVVINEAVFLDCVKAQSHKGGATPPPRRSSLTRRRNTRHTPTTTGAGG